MIVATMMIAGVLTAEPTRNVYRPLSYSVTTTSKKIMPFVTPRDTTMWSETNVVAYGDYLRVPTNNANQLYYWCVVAGTTTNTEPTWISTNDIVDGSVTWRYINPDRHGFTFQHGSTNKLFPGWSVPAESGKGQVVLGGYTGVGSSGFYKPPVWKGEVYVLFDGGTNDVIVQEF